MLSPWSSSHIWGDRRVVHLVVPNFDRMEVGRFRENAIDKRHSVCNVSGSYYVLCCSWEGEEGEEGVQGQPLAKPI